ncbi:MAG: hypothetical protein WAZ48_03270 [Lysobacteraceae bacterium]
MDKNHLFGFWKEDYGDNFPPLVDASRCRWDPALQVKVVSYLQRCPIWIASPGAVCSLLDEGVVAGTVSIRTDGKWAWQETVAHYVGQHQLALPSEFLAHLELRNYLPPTEQEVDVAALNFPEMLCN